jgi:transcriptional regulator with XRE-family HTH domain
VRAARAYAGYSRNALAAEAGFSRSQLASIEAGRRSPTESELAAVAVACGLTLDFFSAAATNDLSPATRDLLRGIRRLRDKLDGLLEPTRDRNSQPVRGDEAALLDLLDPTFEGIDPRLIRALENPLRTRLLTSCFERPRSARDLSYECDVPLDEVLEQLDVLVRTEAVERVVRAGEVMFHGIVWHMLNDRQLAYFPVEFRRRQVTYVLDLIQDDVRAAMASGGFDGETVHLSRSPQRLDARGYESIVALLTDVLLRALQINAESDARRTYGETEEEIETELAILHFHREAGGRSAAVAAAERS